MKQGRSKKYGNTLTSYKGRVFHSKKEAEHAARLDLLRHAKKAEERVVRVEYQVPISLDIGKVHVANYIADFVVYYADGRKQVQDVKGFRTDIYKFKKKMVWALHGIEIVEI